MRRHPRDTTGDLLELLPGDVELPEGGEGLPTVLSPAEPDPTDDPEDDDAYAALLEDSPPGEAARVLEDMRPLSREEREILSDFPELGDLRKVDDSEHEKYLADLARGGYTAMDTALDDASYGDPNMNHEEKLERIGRDSDVGFGIPGLSSLKKAAGAAVKYGQKGLTAPLSVARRGGSMALKYGRKGLTAPLGFIKKFVPKRDLGKAKMVKDLNRKLVVEHANWLGLQDQRTGRPVQSPSYYQRVAIPWARQQIAKAGLPTQFAVRGADVLGADIAGDEVMGSWWNPLSWFSEKVNVVVNQTAGARSPVGPDGQPIDPNAVPGEADPYSDPYAAQKAYPGEADPYAAQEAYPGEADPYAAQEAYPQDYAYGDLSSGISGDDSLGAFTTEILTGAASDTPKDDQLITIAARKLSQGKALSPGELGLVATIAARGNPRAQKLYSLLQAEGAPATSGAWLHKINPAYWFKSADERRFKDAEVEKWKENAEIRRKLEKRAVVLSQAEKAREAAASVESARAQAATTEAQLKAIEASISGHFASSDTSGLETIVGHEKPTAVSEVVQKALEQQGLKKKAVALYAKIVQGAPLTKEDTKDALTVARALNKAKVVHGDLHKPVPPELTMLHGAFVGACLRGVAQSSLRTNAACQKVADALATRIASGSSSDAEQRAAKRLQDHTASLQDKVRKYTSGAAFAGLDDATKLRRACVAGAAKAAMTPAEKKMLSAIVKLAKAGNPRATESLKRLKQSGAVVGGDHVGISFNIKDAFKYATAPIWLPAKHVAKAAKWTGQKLGIVSKGGSTPQQARLARMQAAAKRRAAAQARARAADAQTEAELRAQQSIADAADAEAEAADAEALSKEAAMRTQEIEADPEQAYATDDESGAFVGGWGEYTDVGDAPVLAKASEKSPAGAKIRAGSQLYAKVLKGDKQATEALVKMMTSAKAKDPQAVRDLAAVRAGKKALAAKKRAQKKQARALAKKEHAAKVRAVQKKVEAGIANKLARTERRVELSRLAKVERRAAQGNKPARAYVAKQVVLAKKGDKRAAAKVQKLRLAKQVRQAAPTKRERRNLAAAHRLYAKASRGNPKAVRQIRVIEASAKAGNPNAKRAVERLKIARAAEAAIATGAVALAATAAKPKTHEDNSEVARRALAKMRAGTGTREELAAGSRAAKSIGKKDAAASLAVAASRAPSATETLQRTASVVTAKEAGSAEAKSAIENSLADARKGDADGIKKAGHVVAVNTLRDVEQGRPISPAMRDAVALQERAAVGDPVAIEQTRQITEAATLPNPPAEATAAAVTLAAAAVTAKAMAAKPETRKQYLEKVNAVPPEARGPAEQELNTYLAKANDGTITPEEGAVGVRLAERLGKPRVAAEIAAKAPPPPESTPLSSMPDVPLQPISGFWALLGESLKAVTFSTRDPLANYREGIATRAASPAPAPESSSGWSPFDYFRKMIPGAALATSAAALVSSITRKSEKKVAEKSPVPMPATAPLPAETADKVTEKVAEVTSSGDDPTFTDYVTSALQSKKMSRRDFNRAVEAQVGPGAERTKKEAVGKKVLDFLAAKGVKIEG